MLLPRRSAGTLPWNASRSGGAQLPNNALSRPFQLRWTRTALLKSVGPDPRVLVVRLMASRKPRCILVWVGTLHCRDMSEQDCVRSFIQTAR